ncbi:hypothetical protein [Sphaerisporangium rufum]|nr:hypothetical protein [Sphaerisporangium rufum]
MVVLDPEVERNLGPRIIEHRPATGGSGARFAVILGIAACVAGVLLMWAGTAADVRTLGVLGLLTFVGGLTMFAFSVKTAVQGAQHYSLHPGGLVRVRKGAATVLPWPEVAAITRKRAPKAIPSLGVTRETIMGYKVTPRNGKGFVLVVTDHKEVPARFCAQLEQLATGARVPVSG